MSVAAGDGNETTLQKVQRFKAELAAAKTPEERSNLQQQITAQLMGSRTTYRRPVSLSTKLLLVACFVSIGVLMAAVHPLRMGEDFVLMGLISLPLAGAILFLLTQKNPVWPYRSNLNPDFGSNGQPAKPAFSAGRLYFSRIFYFLGICAMCACLGLGLNQWLDQSTPTARAFTIIEKHITRDKHGNPTYHVQIQSPIDSPIPSIDFGGREDIVVWAQDYNRVVPGRTKITLNISDGFFHLPWRSRAYNLSP
jgi:hypothetical protein